MADFLGMMKQAAHLQSKMQAMQEELGHVEVEGVSGGGLVTALNDARRKAEAAMQEKMQSLTGGLGLPPGLGLT